MVPRLMMHRSVHAVLLGVAFASSARADIRPGLGTPAGPVGEGLVVGVVALGFLGFLVWLLRKAWLRGAEGAGSSPE